MPQKLTPDQIARITEGAKLILTNWYAFKGAVEQGYGGHENDQKAAWFVDTITDYLLETGHKLNHEDLSFILEDILCEEFQTMLEDHSSFQIADALGDLYVAAVRGAPDALDDLRQISAKRILPPSDPLNDQFCALDLDEPKLPDEPAKPIVDEDGFISVSRPKRSTKKRTKHA